MATHIFGGSITKFNGFLPKNEFVSLSRDGLVIADVRATKIRKVISIPKKFLSNIIDGALISESTHIVLISHSELRIFHIPSGKEVYKIRTKKYSVEKIVNNAYSSSFIVATSSTRHRKIVLFRFDYSSSDKTLNISNPIPFVSYIVSSRSNAILSLASCPDNSVLLTHGNIVSTIPLSASSLQTGVIMADMDPTLFYSSSSITCCCSSPSLHSQISGNGCKNAIGLTSGEILLFSSHSSLSRVGSSRLLPMTAVEDISEGWDSSGCKKHDIKQYDTVHVHTNVYSHYKARLHWHSAAVNTLCFHDGGDTLLSGGSENSLVCWDMMNVQPSFVRLLVHPIAIHLPPASSTLPCIAVVQRNNAVVFIRLHSRTYHSDTLIAVLQGIHSKTPQESIFGSQCDIDSISGDLLIPSIHGCCQMVPILNRKKPSKTIKKMILDKADSERFDGERKLRKKQGACLKCNGPVSFFSALDKTLIGMHGSIVLEHVPPVQTKSVNPQLQAKAGLSATLDYPRIISLSVNSDILAAIVSTSLGVYLHFFSLTYPTCSIFGSTHLGDSIFGCVKVRADGKRVVCAYSGEIREYDTSGDEVKVLGIKEKTSSGNVISMEYSGDTLYFCCLSDDNSLTFNVSHPSGAIFSQIIDDGDLYGDEDSDFKEVSSLSRKLPSHLLPASVSQEIRTTHKISKPKRKKEISSFFSKVKISVSTENDLVSDILDRSSIVAVLVDDRICSIFRIIEKVVVPSGKEKKEEEEIDVVNYDGLETDSDVYLSLETVLSHDDIKQCIGVSQNSAPKIDILDVISCNHHIYIAIRGPSSISLLSCLFKRLSKKRFNVIQDLGSVSQNISIFGAQQGIVCVCEGDETNVISIFHDRAKDIVKEEEEEEDVKIHPDAHIMKNAGLLDADKSKQIGQAKHSVIVKELSLPTKIHSLAEIYNDITKQIISWESF
ncbi:hypothetical protein ADUPG1_002219 [Aduncisulcus paluster]|uniref:Uncharacterized protein n=1 Tax=Aduncisulcus paluster TaxID=2918883 RepID=A0ABQ5KHW4_9EUKA|nr:hypothetical protein ADUPG1_002219 [Aduncisulcus paluster]